MAVTFVKAKPLSLKAHPEYNEKWLQALIAEDPAVLGLGELLVKDIERRQPRAGRLDLLLSDPETSTRYEVEIQLGATDEAHIIRTIEYWDIENTRYPAYDHVGVIVAEDVTSRFLNVISLLNRTVPLIAVQLNAWDVNGVTTLTAIRVLDLMLAAPDDEDDDPRQSTDRSYWEARSSAKTLAMADDMLKLVRKATGDDRLGHKYNKQYIGLAPDGVPDNFVTMRPRKNSQHMFTEMKVARSDELDARMEEAGLDILRYNPRYGAFELRLTPEDLTRNRALLMEIVQKGSGLTTPEIESTTDD